MIPRLNRLPSTHLISSRTFVSPLFTLKFSNTTLSYPRFAFVVAKRIDKRAVVRNRLKRVLREIVYQQVSRKNISGDFLFIVKKNFIDSALEQIASEVEQVLKQIRV